MKYTQQIVSRKTLLFTAILLAALLSPATWADSLQRGTDFSQLAKDMSANTQPLILVFDAEHCHYCARLQADHLDPMSVSEDYQHVLLRSLEFEGDTVVTDFDGQVITAREFSRRYRVRLTPTLLFLNAEGEEIAERLLGYNTPELYGAYLDRAIERAVARMRSGTASAAETANRSQ